MLGFDLSRAATQQVRFDSLSVFRQSSKRLKGSVPVGSLPYIELRTNETASNTPLKL